MAESAKKNKVKYGLRNVHYALLTEAADGAITYVAPVAIPGAVSLSLDPEGESSTFRADDVAYAVFSSNNGYTGDLEIALLPDSFRTDVLGDFEDTNKILIENADAPTVPFALLFEFQGDAKATRHVLYNCTAARPKIEGETKGESIEAKTETLSLVASPRTDNGTVKAKTSEETPAATYDNWYKTVYDGTASPSA